jgi:hypothetical protein
VGGDGEIVKAFRVAAGIAAAVTALVISARVLRIEEFTEATRRIVKRLAPSRR